jgi:hypothetical protein
MKTTIDIAGPLLAEARAVAEREKTTLRALIEEGLREVLRRKTAPRPFRLKDCSSGGGGLTPEFEARGGMAKLREAAYPGFFDDDEDDVDDGRHK